MVVVKRVRLSQADWLLETLEVLQQQGIDGVKIVVIAERLGVTSGSFYWHFKNLRDLTDKLLEYWERELTDAVVVVAKAYDGPPEGRILNLMLQVVREDAAVFDHAISIWARKDPAAQKVFERVLNKRFDFARWMFKQVGFGEKEARIRGRLMVAYLMGESATDLKSQRNWKAEIKATFEVLMGRGDRIPSSRSR